LFAPRARLSYRRTVPGDVVATCPACGGRVGRRWPAVATRRVVLCARCGLGIQLDPPPPASALYGDGYYDGARRYAYVDYVGDESAHRRNARGRLHTLARLLGGELAGKRILDVGCAFGFFLDEAHRRRADARGVELSAAASSYARDALGLDVETAPFADARAEGFFDAVTMFDYVEHTVDPAADLARARALIAPGGALLLSTGDRRAPAARLMGRRWHLIQPDYHLFYFTTAALKAMLARAGWEVARVARPWRWLSVGAGIEKLAPNVALRRMRALVPVNLGDIVEVAAIPSK
jgi:SAM-dependent methyltransferase